MLWIIYYQTHLSFYKALLSTRISLSIVTGKACNKQDTNHFLSKEVTCTSFMNVGYMLVKVYQRVKK